MDFYNDPESNARRYGDGIDGCDVGVDQAIHKKWSGEVGMVAMMQSFQQFFRPLLLIGVATGALALIPVIGWALGVSVFILSLRYTQRETLSIDVMTTLALWIAMRVLAMELHIV